MLSLLVRKRKRKQNEDKLRLNTMQSKPTQVVLASGGGSRGRERCMGVEAVRLEIWVRRADVARQT